MSAAASENSPSLLPLSRREFLGVTTAVLATVAVGSFSVQAQPHEAKDVVANQTLVGSNIYGWGQSSQREQKKLDVEDVISALRDTGYDYLEANLDVNRPEENGRFAEQLKAKGLQPVSLYVGARLHEADKAKKEVAKVLAAARIAHQAGFRVLSCNAEAIGREKTEEELRVQAAAWTDLGVGLKSMGMNLGIHHHLPEMANHAREFHYNFDHTKSREVGWCYDVHWVWKGGVPPLEALHQYGERLVTWHLRQSRNGVWWEILDTGDIDYAAIAQFAATHHLARRFSVELALEPGTQITRTAVENHRLSREFVRRTFEV